MIPACATPGTIPECTTPGVIPECAPGGDPCFGRDGQGRGPVERFAVTIAGASSCGCYSTDGQYFREVIGNPNGTWILQAIGGCQWFTSFGRQFTRRDGFGECLAPVSATECEIRLRKMTDPDTGAPEYTLRFRCSTLRVASMRQQFRGNTMTFSTYDPDEGPAACTSGPFGEQPYRYPNGILVTPL